jgi:tetratricopeptide (TPR) repeat protein
VTAILIALLAFQMSSREASIASALKELNEGRVLESITRLKEITRSDPTNAAAYFYLSTLYTQMSEYDTAETYLKRAMEAAPKQAAHSYQLGVIRYRQKQWREALQFFTQSLADSAGNKASEAAAWRGIGDAELELFDRNAAFDAYTKALERQPNDARAHSALGRLALDRNEPAGAIKYFREALELDSSLQAVYPLLGRAYRQAGDGPAAVAVLQKALEMDAADQESRYTLGQTLLSIGKLDDGRAELSKYESIRDQVKTAQRNYEIGVSKLEGGKTGEAENYLREAVRLAPKYAPALQLLGTVLLERGSTESAIEFLKRSADVNPLSAATWFGLGSAYFKAGKLDVALEAAKRATVLNENDAKYQQLVATIQKSIRK